MLLKEGLGDMQVLHPLRSAPAIRMPSVLIATTTFLKRAGRWAGSVLCCALLISTWHSSDNTVSIVPSTNDASHLWVTSREGLHQT